MFIWAYFYFTLSSFLSASSVTPSLPLFSITLFLCIACCPDRWADRLYVGYANKETTHRRKSLGDGDVLDTLLPVARASEVTSQAPIVTGPEIIPGTTPAKGNRRASIVLTPPRESFKVTVPLPSPVAPNPHEQQQKKDLAATLAAANVAYRAKLSVLARDKDSGQRSGNDGGYHDIHKQAADNATRAALAEISDDHDTPFSQDPSSAVGDESKQQPNPSPHGGGTSSSGTGYNMVDLGNMSLMVLPGERAQQDKVIQAIMPLSTTATDVSSPQRDGLSQRTLSFSQHTAPTLNQQNSLSIAGTRAETASRGHRPSISQRAPSHAAPPSSGVSAPGSVETPSNQSVPVPLSANPFSRLAQDASSLPVSSAHIARFNRIWTRLSKAHNKYFRSDSPPTPTLHVSQLPSLLMRLRHGPLMPRLSLQQIQTLRDHKRRAARDAVRDFVKLNQLMVSGGSGSSTSGQDDEKTVGNRSLGETKTQEGLQSPSNKPINTVNEGEEEGDDPDIITARDINPHLALLTLIDDLQIPSDGKSHKYILLSIDLYIRYYLYLSTIFISFLYCIALLCPIV